MERFPPSIVLVSAFDPEAVGNGSSLRARRWREALSSIGRLEVVVVPVVASDPVSAHRRLELPDDEACARGAVQLAGARWRDWMVRTAPLPAAADRAPAWMGRRLLTDLARPPDVVVAFKMAVAPLAADLAMECGAPLVVDLDDDEPSLATPGPAADALERLLRGVGDLASVVTVAAAADRSPVQARVAAPVMVVPNVVPVPAVSPPGEPGRALYVANFGYAPNRESADWLLGEVVPRAHGLDRLDIVGAGSRDLSVGDGPVVVAHGRLPDLAPCYAAASVVACPVRRGSGTSIKVLEAMAHGLPVVTTTVGARGLDLDDGVHAVITDDPVRFADALSRLARPCDEATTLAAAGRRRVAERYSLEAGADAMRAVVASARTIGPR